MPARNTPQKTPLQQKLCNARVSRGWSHYEVSRQTLDMGHEVHRNSLRALEGSNTSRQSDGASVKVATLVMLCELYWPDLQLRDFVPETVLELRRP